ncbi:MAG: hypothetical protein H7Y00_03525 [Fimbriimonadaceae bacterium]|nr:hypothetical protein [Chitinophagales bacterium]
MRILLFVCATFIFISSNTIEDKNCAYCEGKNVGSSWEFTFYKDNGKIQIISRTTLKEISDGDSTTDYHMEVETLNEKGKNWMGVKPYPTVMKVLKNEPYYYTDMSGGADATGNKYMRMSCDEDALNDEGMPDIRWERTTTEGTGASQKTYTSYVELIDFTYAPGTETVKIGKGEFECIKMTYTILTGSNGITLGKLEQYVTTWTSNEYGTVKIEIKDKKGKMLRYGELTDYNFL